MNVETLPHGWALATIPQLIGPRGEFSDGDWVESKDQDPAGDVRLIQLADVGDGEYRSKSARYLTSVKARELRCTFLKRGDVLVARMPDPLGRACIFPGDPKPSVTVVDVCIARPGEDSVDAQWLMWAINSPQFRGAVSSLQSGSTRKRISRGNLATISVPVPPLAEQSRIVAAIEERLSDFDAAVAGLDRARSNLGRYRDALWAAAIGGSFGAETYRHSNCTPGSLPAGWSWTTVEASAAPEPNAITDGPFGSKLKTQHYAEFGPRVIRLQNVGRGEFIDARAHITQEHFETLTKHRVFPGDVIIAALGETLPRACVIPHLVGPAIVKADCIRFKPNPSILLAAFANIALNAEPTRRRVTAMVHGVGRPRLNVGEIKSISFPLPPIDEQRAIVAAVEQRLAVADRTSAEIELQLARAARLRQGILTRAFEGKLVPQDPRDEPASVLLDRIRAARDTSRARDLRRRAAPMRS